MDIKLLHGDCLEVMKDIPDKSIDMILCDLPFGITASSWDKQIPAKNYGNITTELYQATDLSYCLQAVCLSRE